MAAPRPSYLCDPAAITRRSYEIIRAEADLSRLPAEAHGLALRLIHSCGMTDLASDLVVGAGAIAAGRGALGRGAPILCDVEMVMAGITRRLLPARNDVYCAIAEPAVAAAAAAGGTTRAALGVEQWVDALDGAVVTIGNAPTALYRLLEGLAEGWPRPALIIAVPVGFVGAVESKEALLAAGTGVPYIVLRGRRGGSALAAAAINALAAPDTEA
jgi:precorrin-8X/cobalt-precorrin-8 methylmutase